MQLPTIVKFKTKGHLCLHLFHPTTRATANKLLNKTTRNSTAPEYQKSIPINPAKFL